MTLVPTIEGIVIVLVLVASLLLAWRRLLPASSVRGQTAVARWLGMPMRPRLLQALGKRLLPDTQAAVGCGVKSGCSACGQCPAASSRPNAAAQSFTPRPPRAP
ncbi:MAG: DUF6587 family protein [Dokdonella sp.]